MSDKNIEIIPDDDLEIRLKNKLEKIKRELIDYRANEREIVDEYVKYGICEHGYVGHTGSIQNCNSCGKVFCFCEMGFRKVNVIDHIIPIQMCNNCWDDEDLFWECLRRKYNSYFVPSEHIINVRALKEIQRRQLIEKEYLEKSMKEKQDRIFRREIPQ